MSTFWWEDRLLWLLLPLAGFGLKQVDWTEPLPNPLRATMVQGNVDAFRAYWEITPIDATHTLVEFRILVDPDMPLPSSLFTDQNVKAARNTIRSVRRRMAS